MKKQTTRDLVRFHIDASLDALGLLSESERAEIALEVAASLAEMAHRSLARSLDPQTSLRLLVAAEELRAGCISERNR
ncbi:hypothetical protein, partial [Halomonas marinisediminis]